MVKCSGDGKPWGVANYFIVNVLFQALDEPSFSVAYASMCKYMLQVNILCLLLTLMVNHESLMAVLVLKKHLGRNRFHLYKSNCETANSNLI